MATRTATEQDLTGKSALTRLYAWEGLLDDDVGSALNVSEAGVSLTAQVIGTPNGATLTLRGSNKLSPDPTVAADWFTLKLTDGSDAAFTAAGGGSLADLPLWISPHTTGGGASQDLDVLLMVR